METSLVLSANIDRLLAQREAFKSQITQAALAMAQAKSTYEDSPLGYSDPEDRYRQDFERLAHCTARTPGQINAEAFLKGFDAFGWDYLMRASGMRTFMSAAAKQRWEKGIYERETPELTMENIVATFEKLHASRAELFDEGIVDCFRALSWDYKTNNPRKFGKRLILRGYGSISNDSCAKIDDLRRAFSVADGKPEPDCRQGVERAFSYKQPRGLIPFEDSYVKVKAFINGNIHVAFKRPELVDHLNLVLARRCPGALPCPRD